MGDFLGFVSFPTRTEGPLSRVGPVLTVRLQYVHRSTEATESDLAHRSHRTFERLPLTGRARGEPGQLRPLVHRALPGSSMPIPAPAALHPPAPHAVLSPMGNVRTRGDTSGSTCSFEVLLWAGTNAAALPVPRGRCGCSAALQLSARPSMTSARRSDRLPASCRPFADRVPTVC